MVRNLKAIQTIVFIILVLSTTSHLFAATIMEERQYEPVVIGAGSLVNKMDKTDIDLIKLYAFDAASNAWRPIPFQIDEMVRTKVGTYPKDSTNLYIETDNNPAFDAERNGTDEFVLMARDLGDKAAANQWPDDAESQSSHRVVLELTDPLNPELKGYAYLYLSSTLAIDSENVYDLSYDDENDAVDAKSYRIAFDPNHGLIRDIGIKAPWGDGTDIIDAQKLRFEGTLNSGSLFIYTPGYNNLDTATEENTLYLFQQTGTYSEHYYRKTTTNPQIRLIRQVKQTIQVFGDAIPGFAFYFKTKFYPYSGEVGINVPLSESITEEYIQAFDFEMDMARISLDYNANAAGMLFNNAYNTDIPVDGVTDAVNQTINTDSIITTWALVSGTQGSVFTYFSIADTSWKDIALYYYDHQAGGNADGSTITTGEHADDTGDGVSYADNGLLVRNNENKGLDLKFDMKFYFLPSSFSKEDAAVLAEQIENPLSLNVSTEAYTVSVKEKRSSLPDGFRLSPNYPNPFNSQTLFEFENDKAQNIRLIVYDSQGRAVKQLADGIFPAGVHTLPWNGTDSKGKTVPTGIYLYRLWAEGKTLSGKLMLMK